MESAMEKIDLLIKNIEKVIVGKTEAVKLLLTGLLTNGHILIEDIPGMGKTMLSLALARSMGGDFKRVQFTPDLLPSDITGGVVYNPKSGEFELSKGPVFTNILLADEVNRTTPKTQSSLLECMQEYRVTLGRQTLSLPKPFLVVATQNPIEFQGTYALPEAQVDRFLMKIDLGYLPAEQEIRVIKEQRVSHPIDSLEPVLNLEEIQDLQEKVKKIEISDKILKYIVSIVSGTRNLEYVKLGASPRASISLMHSARAWALIEKRDYVIPDDIYHLAFWILSHRIVVSPRAAVEGITAKTIISNLLNKTPVI